MEQQKRKHSNYNCILCGSQNNNRGATCIPCYKRFYRAHKKYETQLSIVYHNIDSINSTLHLQVDKLPGHSEVFYHTWYQFSKKVILATLKLTQLSALHTGLKYVACTYLQLSTLVDLTITINVRAVASCIGIWSIFPESRS